MNALDEMKAPTKRAPQKIVKKYYALNGIAAVAGHTAHASHTPKIADRGDEIVADDGNQKHRMDTSPYSADPALPTDGNEAAMDD